VDSPGEIAISKQGRKGQYPRGNGQTEIVPHEFQTVRCTHDSALFPSAAVGEWAARRVGLTGELDSPHQTLGPQATSSQKDSTIVEE